MYDPTAACWAKLRPELLRRARPDGGLDLLDPLCQRVVTVAPDTVTGFQAETPAAKLAVELLMVLDDDVATSLRDNAWAAKTQLRVPPVSLSTLDLATVDFDFDSATGLGPLVSPWWRDGERFRALAEERRAGRRYHVLRGFFARDAADTLRATVAGLEFARIDTELLTCARHPVADHELTDVVALMQSPLLRGLLSPVVGRKLPAGTVINAWRLKRGDSFGIHPDGPRYQGTFSVGLCDGWRASEGGAIAFGEPTTDRGFVVSERWLPQLGDLLVFAPDHDTWHAVEPVTSDRERLTLTGFWTES